MDGLKKIDYFNHLPQFTELCDRFPQIFLLVMIKLIDTTTKNIA